MQQVIDANGCSTVPVAGLSKQLVEELNCMEPGLMTALQETKWLVFSDSVRAIPFLQTSAANSLYKVVEEGQRRMTIDVGIRTLPQQLLRYEWRDKDHNGIGGMGGCNIPKAAKPPSSNYLNGTAVDVWEAESWVAVMNKHGFKPRFNLHGSGARTYFNFETGRDVQTLAVKAFQRLWNRFHPEDEIEVRSLVVLNRSISSPK